MRFIKILSFMFILVTVYSCVKNVKVITLLTKFDPQKAEYIFKDGTNTISGQSFLVTRGGDPKTCAGQEVSLVPVTDYAKERMEYRYGSAENGFRSHSNNGIKFSNDDENYHKYTKTAFCDASGNFTFEKVADGEYFVTTSVLWEILEYNIIFNTPVNVVEGGVLMQKVSVSGGEHKKILVLGK